MTVREKKTGKLFTVLRESHDIGTGKEWLHIENPETIVPVWWPREDLENMNEMFNL